jgi:hypothetical protein
LSSSARRVGSLRRPEAPPFAITRASAVDAEDGHRLRGQHTIAPPGSGNTGAVTEIRAVLEEALTVTWRREDMIAVLRDMLEERRDRFVARRTCEGLGREVAYPGYFPADLALPAPLPRALPRDPSRVAGRTETDSAPGAPPVEAPLAARSLKPATALGATEPCGADARREENDAGEREEVPHAPLGHKREGQEREHSDDRSHATASQITPRDQPGVRRFGWFRNGLAIRRVPHGRDLTMTPRTRPCLALDILETPRNPFFERASRARASHPKADHFHTPALLSGMSDWVQRNRNGRLIHVEGGVRAKRQRSPINKLLDTAEKVAAMHDALRRGDQVAFYRAAYGAKAAKAAQLWEDGHRRAAIAEMARIKFPDLDVYQRMFDALGERDRDEH